MKRKILFYGDSNTWGFDPRGPVPGRWPEGVRWSSTLGRDIAQYCTEHGRAEEAGDWEFAFDAMNGRCIPERGAALKNILARINQEQPLTAFAVMLGSNDLLEGWYPDPERVADRMRLFVRTVMYKAQLREHGTKLILIAPTTMEGEGEEWQGVAEEYRDHLLRVATREGGLFVDALSWQPPLAFDGLHLSDEGHRVFSKHLAAFLAENL